MELFVQSEQEALARAEALRSRGLTVDVKPYSGGYGLVLSGPEEVLREVEREVHTERLAEHGRVLTGTVRWWKDATGYGRITGDDGYIYFCHFSGIDMDGYRTLSEGQRVEFTRGAGVADHGRAVAEDVRVID